jgi:hypothetical protein
MNSVNRIAKSSLFWTLVSATALMLTGCASTQFTLYKPSEDEPSWRITVVKEAIGEKFVCSIDDTVVIEANFALFKNSFEMDGTHLGKPVKMSGYRKTQVSAGSDGNVDTNHTYQIRVFIDEEEVGKFVF